MATQPDNKVDLDQSTPEEDAFTSEGGHVGPEPEAPAEPSNPTSDERRRSMSEFSIGYDGRRYRWGGYRYDRLADAVAYAGLMRSKQAQEGRTASLPRGHAAIDLPSPLPSQADRQLMAELSVSFEAGVYVSRGFRYDSLADAQSYARLCQRKQALEGAP